MFLKTLWIFSISLYLSKLICLYVTLHHVRVVDCSVVCLMPPYCVAIKGPV